MAISTKLRAAEGNISTPRRGRKLLQRLVRKVQLVLVIRHSINDLKESGGLGHWHDDEIVRK